MSTRYTADQIVEAARFHAGQPESEPYDNLADNAGGMFELIVVGAELKPT